MGSIQQPDVNFDVIIIGAGISGINAAYRIQTELPTYSYTVLENREAIGGTWDLFRYPGIRSDSDLHTFGFPWYPWSKPKAIAEGNLIKDYVKEAASLHGLDKKVQFKHKLLAADWSTPEQKWKLSVDANGSKTTFRAKFIIISTGYYDYNEPLKAAIPGIDNFRGQTIHPQFWPEDLDYAGKKMIIIGSGATAITLLPNLANKAAKVTMLQRSPTYVIALPSVDPTGDFIRRWFPWRMASMIVRLKFLILPFLFFKFCRAYPNVARSRIRKAMEPLLPSAIPYDPNFTPSYGPWEQRLCVCPDGDFFTALKQEKADIVTDTIRTVTETGIETAGGKTLDADIIITATGLKMQMAGGATISVDGKEFHLNEKFMWKGAMLQDLPNAAFVLGYTNASWTLGADTTALQVVRLLKHMQKMKQTSAVPRVATGDKDMKIVPVLNLSSTYIEKAKGAIPVAGANGCWRPRSDYLSDYWSASYGKLTDGLQFVTGGKVVKSA